MSIETLQVGFVGGGSGAFFGGVHRKTTYLNREQGILPHCGVFDVDPDKSMEDAKTIGLIGYRTVEEMIAAEKNNLGFVMVATPDGTHLPIVQALLEADIPVVCEKPPEEDLPKTLAMAKVAKAMGVPLTFNWSYTGYPNMRLMAAICSAGLLGTIRRIQGTYVQDWLQLPLEKNPVGSPGQQQAVGRTDFGVSCDAADIGIIHPSSVISLCLPHVSAKRVWGRLSTMVSGRKLDDNMIVVVEIDGPGVAPGADIAFYSSQTMIGKGNHHFLSIAGEQGTVYADIENPEIVKLSLANQPDRVFQCGRGFGDDPVMRNVTDPCGDIMMSPPGHIGTFWDALTYLQRLFAKDVRDWRECGKRRIASQRSLGIREGVFGMQLLQAAVDSTQRGNVWVNCKSVDELLP